MPAAYMQYCASIDGGNRSAVHDAQSPAAQRFTVPTLPKGCSSLAEVLLPGSCGSLPLSPLSLAWVLNLLQLGCPHAHLVSFTWVMDDALGCQPKSSRERTRLHVWSGPWKLCWWHALLWHGQRNFFHTCKENGGPSEVHFETYRLRVGQKS